MTALLALETSGTTGSVALAVEGVVRARRFLEQRGRHAALLPGAMEAVMSEAGCAWSDLVGVAVGSGPGSFTGVRVAAAAANGVAHARGVPVYPVSSLAAAAVAREALPTGVGPWSDDADIAPPGVRVRRVLFDARQDRLFTAAFEVTEGGLRTLAPPTFARLDDVLGDARARDVGAVFCGDGARRHREALESAGFVVLSEPHGVPLADGVIEVLGRAPGSPSFPAGSWAPDYLRDTGAVRARAGDDS